MQRYLMDSWDDLRLFLHAAEAGSLAKGAERAGCSTATMSRRLSRLESGLGLLLLHRHAGGVSLTPEASSLLPAVRTVAGAVKDVRRGAGVHHRDETKKVVVSTIETVVTHIIAPQLHRFYEEHPRIDLVLRAQARVVSVGDRAADLALRLGRPQESNVRGKRLAQSPMCLYASERYVREYGRDIDSLEAHRVVLLPERLDAMPEHQWALERLGGRKAALRVTTISAGLRAIESGAVIGLMPRFMGHGLVELCAPDLPPRDLWLVVHEDLRSMPHVRAVADFLETCVRPRTTLD